MSRRFAVLALLLVLPLAGCSEPPSVAAKGALANRYLREHAGDAAYRALAWDMYQDVIADGGDPALVRDAHFGLGAIALFDLLQGIGNVLAPLPVTPETTAEDDEGVPLPPIEDLVGVIDTALHQLLEAGIVEHWGELVGLGDYAFTFDEGAALIAVGDAATIDLSGEWDLTEIRMVYGVLQVALTTGELLLSYDGVLGAVLEAAFSDAEVPELPGNPAEIPDWLVDAALAAGLDPLPWLRPSFGRLQASDEQLDAMRARLADGTAQLAAAFEYAMNEGDPQDDDLADKDSFLAGLLIRILGEDAEILNLIGGVLPGADDLQATFAALHESVAGDAAFVLPPGMWEFLKLALAVLQFDGARPPADPAALRIPALRTSRLFTHPVRDLKHRERGLLPWTCTTAAEVEAWGCSRIGAFVVRAEQEPWTDDDDDGVVDDREFADRGVDGFVDANDDGEADDPLAGRPGRDDGVWWGAIALNDGDEALEDPDDASLQPSLAHRSPTAASGWDPSNGIVDPVYLFMPNPGVNGLLLPIVDANADPDEVEWRADPSGRFRNGDVMRLLSSLSWLLGSSTIEDLTAEP